MKRKHASYDRETLQPAIRRSICTGEQTAGFVERETGRFHEDRLLQSEQDLRAFRRDWGIEQEEIREIF